MRLITGDSSTADQRWLLATSRTTNSGAATVREAAESGHLAVVLYTTEIALSLRSSQ
jgi:hypothetical protein